MDTEGWTTRDWTLFVVKNLILWGIIVLVIMRFPEANVPLNQNMMIAAVAVIIFIILQFIGDPTFGIRSWICGCDADAEGFETKKKPSS